MTWLDDVEQWAAIGQTIHTPEYDDIVRLIKVARAAEDTTQMLVNLVSQATHDDPGSRSAAEAIAAPLRAILQTKEENDEGQGPAV